MKKLFVGNLPYSATDQDLHEAFSAFGQVSSANVVLDRETGRSRGFGFVEMPDDAEADRAIEEMNGADLGGRNLTVNEARPREARGGFGGGGRGGFGGGGARGGFGGGGRGGRGDSGGGRGDSGGGRGDYGGDRW